MRIIGGQARGRRLRSPDTRETRPVTDRVREAVFSMLGESVEQGRVLDLYAGSGSFGLEALSRGAVEAVFVENGRRALKALTDNVSAVGLGGRVVRASVGSYLGGADRGFDVVFVDPPWAMPSSELADDLARIDPLIDPGGQVILSRRHQDDLPEQPPEWRVATDRRYGDTRIMRYVKEAAE